MRPIETIPGMGQGGIKKNVGWSEFNFCKCHNESPEQQKYTNKKLSKLKMDSHILISTTC
jgi:hypothetical protein